MYSIEIERLFINADTGFYNVHKRSNTEFGHTIVIFDI